MVERTVAGGHSVLGYGPFSPADYLLEYYADTSFENDDIMRFFARVATWIGPRATMLEYGGGPTVYQLVSLAPLMGEIWFTDYLESNLDAVRSWVNRDPTAHDWSAFVSCALRHEGRAGAHSDETVEARADLVRRRLTDFGTVDVFNSAVDVVAGRTFDVVGTSFVAESVAVSRDEWMDALGVIATYVAPNGYLIVNAILDATYWMAGNYAFECFPITGVDLEKALKDLGFEVMFREDAAVRQPDPEAPDYEGYDGMSFVLAHRPAP